MKRYCLVCILLASVNASSETNLHEDILIDSIHEVESIKPKILTTEETENVVKHLKYRFVKSEANCVTADQIIFDKQAYVDISFSGTNRKLVLGNFSVCQQPSWATREVLVLIENNAIKATFENAHIDDIQKVNLGKVTEIYGLSYGYGQGYQIKKAFMFLIENQNIKIKEFGEVYIDDCGDSGKDGKLGSIISLEKSGKQVINTYKSSCEDNSEYSFVGEGAISKYNN